MAPVAAASAANEKLRRRMRRRATNVGANTNTTAVPSAWSPDECRRPRARRRWVASTAACVVGVMAAARLPAGAMVDAATPARVDGVTYCWQVGGSVYASEFNSSVAVQQGQQDDCAIALTLELSKDAFYVGEVVEASWTATLRRAVATAAAASGSSGSSSSSSAGAASASGTVSFAANKFGLEQLFTAQDRVSQKPYEILISRIESCTAGALDCDPVTGHTELLANVPNRPANFSTASGSVLFSTDRVAFTAPGRVTLVAHIVLPGENPEASRFDFALYKTIAVSERPTLLPVRNETGSSQSEKSEGESIKTNGLSTEVIGIMFVCGMVAVALVAVGFVMIRKNKNELLPPIAQKDPDGRARQAPSTTDLDDEFAMLSNEERFMQSQHGGTKKGNGFLSATARPHAPSMLEESRAAAKAKAEATAPLPYVGQASTRGGGNGVRPNHNHRADASDLASDDHIVDPSNPASMRHHGLYMEMPAPPSRRTQIYYNDIGDHEIIGHQHQQSQLPSRRTHTGPPSGLASSINPFATAREPRLGPNPSGVDGRSVAERLAAGGSPLGLVGGGGGGEPTGADAARWRVSTELTFDDLRPSADLGPALTLDDLLESKQMTKTKRKNQSNAISEE